MLHDKINYFRLLQQTTPLSSFFHPSRWTLAAHPATTEHLASGHPTPPPPSSMRRRWWQWRNGTPWSSFHHRAGGVHDERHTRTRWGLAPVWGAHRLCAMYTVSGRLQTILFQIFIRLVYFAGIRSWTKKKRRKKWLVEPAHFFYICV
jgi:hypothetical protein